MPFNPEFLYNASRPVVVKTIDVDFERAKKIITEAVRLAASKDGHFDPADVDIYIHGSYADKTNIYFPSNLEIVVELKRTTEYDSNKFPHTSYRLFNNYFVETAYSFNPSDFYNILFETLNDITGNRCERENKFIKIPKQPGIAHTLEIMPAFTFNYVQRAEENSRDANRQFEFGAGKKIYQGILIYDEEVSSHLVTFPKLHAWNGRQKDAATNGNFSRMVRLFKTIAKVGQRESDFDHVRGYFISCMLFNVPNEMFIIKNENLLREDDSAGKGKKIHASFYKILNFLLNINISGFVCQNLVWFLFGEAREFWKESAAYQFLKDIQTLYITFPTQRTLLA
ncbi:MAG: hypothetical protein FWE16_05795 [Firmicutes bacterium]|nr:hypothetical protein [Bacillota bacterium]